jgi:hypothetical protein
MLRESVPTLLAGIGRGNLRLLEPLGELLLLPLAFHVVLLLASLLAPGPLARAYAAFAFGVLATHVLGGIAVGGGGLRDVAALAAAPVYVAWKIGLARAIARASRPEATWIRTERAASGTDRR